MRIKTDVLIVLLSIALPGAGAARAQDDPHAACAVPPSYVPADLLERVVPLRTGIGNSHEVVTTKSKEAQAFYDQGLNYLESYVWVEASRSFRRALGLDANLAMAHLGLSYVYSGLENPAAARQSFDKAKALASGVSDRERRRIEIREKQLAALDDIKDTGRFLAYKKAIDDAIAAHLDDPEFWLLRGNAEESNASGRGQRGGAASIAFYDRVLRLVPEHATAHHYLVHSYETVGRVDRALEHGEVYARLAPSIPHAAHMWGHELDAARRELETVPTVTLGIDPPRSMVAPWIDALHGEILLHAGEKEEASVVLTEVTRALRASVGPDAWSQGLFRIEAMAWSAIEAGDWDLAGILSAQMLDHDAAYGGSHFMQALVLHNRGDAAGAGREMEAAKRYWRDADRDLPELKEIAKFGPASGVSAGASKR